MQFLSQSNFPRLWMLFQHLVGGSVYKRRLATMYYKGQKKVLEIGCSVGNVSQVFSKFKQAEFTGIDIDNNALGYARKRLGSLPNFTFRNVALSDLAKTGEKFDYVLFANILHHVDDKTAIILLKDVQLLLSAGATLIVMGSIPYSFCKGWVSWCLVNRAFM
jgi:2-polyprenyl-3-methyl-5-hydroxy-6-metoxy-1,4-benzoquinol methylase